MVRIRRQRGVRRAVRHGNCDAVRPESGPGAPGVKGFRQVVVSADLRPTLGPTSSLRAEIMMIGSLCSLRQAPRQGQTVFARQHQIEDDQVCRVSLPARHPSPCRPLRRHREARSPPGSGTKGLEYLGPSLTTSRLVLIDSMRLWPGDHWKQFVTNYADFFRNQLETPPPHFVIVDRLSLPQAYKAL